MGGVLNANDMQPGNTYLAGAERRNAARVAGITLVATVLLSIAMVNAKRSFGRAERS
ncbi:hypothetical protein ACFLRH_02180 [Actinomycetota bacterium]